MQNGDAETDSFDALNRMVTQVAVNGTTALYTYTYGFDLDGNVPSEAESYPSGLNNRTVCNGYDAVNRLTSESVTGNAPNTVTLYQYDAANNRTQKSVSGRSSPGVTTYSYNNLNQLQSAVGDSSTTSYTYDANGNRLTRAQGSATDSYGYDDENRPVSLSKNTTGGAGTYAYQYDYRTRRITRTENGTSTALVFSGGTSAREYTGSAGGTPTVQYIRGSDYGGGIGGVLYTLRGGAPSYTHENKRGDVIAKTDGSGSLTYQAQYEGFGTRTQEHGSTLDRQKANTKEEDPDGLLDEGMRYRDLETGSFITRDPAGFVDGPNLYTYVVQNPWTKFDPEGLNETTGYNGFGESFIPDPKAGIRQASEGFGEAFDSAGTLGSRSFGAFKGLAYSLDTAVNLIPGEGALEHGVEKIVTTEVKNVLEGKAKQEAKATLENSAKKQGEKGAADAEATVPKGGTYKLKDPETGEVKRTGQTSDLESRKNNHANNPETKGLDFEVDKRTDSLAERRGREEVIHDQHPEAMHPNHPDAPEGATGLNKQRAISPTNKKAPEYRQAEKDRAARDD